jgi:molybdate transport system regulatory protein
MPAAKQTPSKQKAAAPRKPAYPRLRLRAYLAEDVMLGPGKADLLEGIAETGSIAAAGRRMGMSYKRAWMLVETLNGFFRQPLVQAATGGAKGGGAALTPLGQDVLARFRRMEAATVRACAAEIAALQKQRRR